MELQRCFSPRHFDESHDLEAVAVLIEAAWQDYGPNTNFHVGDLYWRMRFPGYPEQLTLWHDGAALAAFSEFTAPAGLEFQVHPAYRSSGIELDILERHEALCLMARNRGDSRARPELAVAETDMESMRRLEERGYRRTGMAYVHFAQDCMRDIPATPLPPGFTVRSVVGPAEARKRAAVHRSAFEGSRTSEAAYLRLMAMPGYRPDLDLVAAAPDGEFAAFAICWTDPVGRVGLFEPVGAHPGYRRLGLARAVIAEGLKRLAAAGMAKAQVVTSSDNTAAIALYLNCGLPLVRTDNEYKLADPTR